MSLHAYAEGRICLQRQRNPWGHSHGVAVLDQQGRLQHNLSRHYPWPWPHCPHAEVFRQTSADQLEAAARAAGSAARRRACARRGRTLRRNVLSLATGAAAAPGAGAGLCPERWPTLRIWHNGGRAPYVRDGLERLGMSLNGCCPPAITSRPNNCWCPALPQPLAGRRPPT